MSPRVFDCDIAPRLRDLNLGMHVDNVEAVRVLDEARHRWVRFAAMDDGATGLYGHDFASLAEMVVGHRIEYRAELRVDLEQPFGVRLWTTRVGRTSLTVAAELRSEPGGEAAVVAETTVVLWDAAAGAAWPIDAAARTRMQAYLGDSVAFRG